MGGRKRLVCVAQENGKKNTLKVDHITCLKNDTQGPLGASKNRANEGAYKTNGEMQKSVGKGNKKLDFVSSQNDSPTAQTQQFQPDIKPLGRGTNSTKQPTTAVYL